MAASSTFLRRRPWIGRRQPGGPRHGIDPAAAAAAGAAAGSVLTYFLDPARGRRRRAMVRDKLVHAAHETTEESQTVARDAQHRAAGFRARLTRPLRRESPTAPRLEERVRAELGRWCSHSGAIDVAVRDGAVTLSGPVLVEEVDNVRKAVGGVRGVETLEDRLQVYETARDIPGIQGQDGPRPGPRPAYLQEVWSPTARLLAILGGAAAVGWGLRERGGAGWATAAAGTVVATRAWTNQPVANLSGIGAGRAAVTVTKTINVAAPVDEVYALWSSPSAFPQFMKNVKEVREGADGHMYWKVRGPVRTTLGFDTEITRQEPNQSIAWTTSPGSLIQHGGRVTFEPTSEAETRVSVRISYNPVFGLTGHTVAKFLGRDPKRQLDQDLLRLQSYLETGTRPHDAAAPVVAIGDR